MDPGPPVSWELASGLTAAFVYDLPTTVRTASADHIEAWAKSHDELLSTALENVHADAVETQPMAEGPSAPIACFADHFFAASHALLLGDRLPPGANRSAVFAVPHRHALLHAPLVDLGVIESINRLIVTGASMFQQGRARSAQASTGGATDPSRCCLRSSTGARLTSPRSTTSFGS